MSSEEEEPCRIVYDAAWEPGEIAGIDGEGLEAGQRVILVQPEGVTEGPLEWPGVVEEVTKRVPGRFWAGVRMAGTALGAVFPVNAWGEFDQIRTEDLPVTGLDGYGCKTPTVRELAAILAALPEQFQDLPVARYCDEGVAGINYELHYSREEGMGNWTAHVKLW